MSNEVPYFSCHQPCSNCPYRTDSTLQLWDKAEFENLLENAKTTILANFTYAIKKTGVVA